MGKLKKLTPRNNEIYLTDVLDELALNDKLLAYTIECKRYDVGDKLGYVKANVEFALKSKEIGAETVEFIKEIAKTL
jgi:UTP--glucose-1-phosphate uridylyltransferase